MMVPVGKFEVGEDGGNASGHGNYKGARDPAVRRRSSAPIIDNPASPTIYRVSELLYFLLARLRMLRGNVKSIDYVCIYK